MGIISDMLPGKEATSGSNRDDLVRGIYAQKDTLQLSRAMRETYYPDAEEFKAAPITDLEAVDTTNSASADPSTKNDILSVAPAVVESSAQLIAVEDALRLVASAHDDQLKEAA